MKSISQGAFAAAANITLMILAASSALGADGTGAVTGWGLGTAPPDVTATVISPASGGHSCAIQDGSGAVVCWGNNGSGEATPPPSVDGTLGTATAVAAGGSHTLAIRRAQAAPLFTEDFSSATFVGTPEIASSERWGPETRYYLPPGFGFSTDFSVPGWTLTTLTVLAVNPADGDMAIGLNETHGHGSATSSPISGFTSGAEYLLTFDHWGDDRPDTTPYEVDVLLDGDVIGHVSRSYSSPGPGAAASIYFTATSTTHSLTFADVTFVGEASALIDNISITFVPEPGSSLMLLTGLGLLAVLRRKSAKTI